MTGSMRVVLIVVGLAMCAGFGILAWRLSRPVGRQKVGATVIHRPALKRTPPAREAKKKGTKLTRIRRPNLAPLATVTVSSVQEGLETSPGVADDATDERHWVSAGETSGAWIQLDWDDPVTVSEIELYDRPSPVENVLAGALLFEDGIAISVPPLPPDGAVWRTVFPPRTIRRLQLRIDRAEGRSAGLAEIRVLGPLQP